MAGRAHRSSLLPRRRATGELEAEVLAALWAADGALTAAHVRQAVCGALAYNTVLPILVRLCVKGLIGRVTDGRRHEDFAVKGAEELAAEQMQALPGRGRDREAVLQRFATSLSVEMRGCCARCCGADDDQRVCARGTIAAAGRDKPDRRRPDRPDAGRRVRDCRSAVRSGDDLGR